MFLRMDSELCMHLHSLIRRHLSRWSIRQVVSAECFEAEVGVYRLREVCVFEKFLEVTSPSGLIFIFVFTPLCTHHFRPYFIAQSS